MAVAIFGAPNRALRLICFAACAHVISFILNFFVFGRLGAPLDAIQYFLISIPVALAAWSAPVRDSFGVRHNEFFWQDIFFFFAFSLILLGCGGTIHYFGNNYPYSRGVWPDEDFRATRPDGDAGDTVEIYGFAFRMPKRFEIARTEHVEAGGVNSASGYDTAVFSDGSSSVSFVTRGGMPMEQLFEKTNIFNIQTAREYSEKFIYEPTGILFLAFKSKAGKYYSYVTAAGWIGYAEQSWKAMKEPIWSFNLWSTDENALHAARISFKFKNREDATAAVKLVNNVVSSLIIGDPEKRPEELLKLATAEIELKNYAAAKTYLADALARDFKNADAHYYMALCLYSGKIVDTAAVEFHNSRVLQLDPAHAGATGLGSKLTK